MRIWLQPQRKVTVTHSGVDYELQNSIEMFEVVLRENAASSAHFMVDDSESSTFEDKCDEQDVVKIEFYYSDEPGASFRTIFGGKITGLRPVYGEKELLRVNCHGYGVGVKDMLVRDQYGYESGNPTLNKIHEVLTDATHGIITKYVNEVMGSGTASGHALTTTKIADLASDFKYLVFPGKPALKAIEDMLDLVSAANTPNAGCHWIVDPSKNFCLATVGNHEDPPADAWPTWFNTDEAGSTIEVKKDMLISAFHKRRSLANYVLFTGKFRFPANGDILTENNAADWDANADYTPEDTTTHRVGAKAILLDKDTAGTGQGRMWYPKTGSLNFDLTKIGTTTTLPVITFYFQKSATTNHRLMLWTGPESNDDYFMFDMDHLTDAWPRWTKPEITIGPYRKDENKWDINNNPSWADIDHIGFRAETMSPTNFIIVDGLHIDGMLTRAAYDSNTYSTECRMMHVRDDVPKDDTLEDTDDSGQIAQFCKAELYRAASTPTIGEIIIPFTHTIMGGQLAHIHFGKKADDNFRIDANYRILKAVHHWTLPHAFTILTLTDDVLNSYARQPTDQRNTLLKAAKPEFQDRLRSSIIMNEADIEQTILAKGYAI